LGDVKLPHDQPGHDELRADAPNGCFICEL
jgi:hypothetical protein